MVTKSNAGFTLLELMIVTEIIAILATLAIPSLLRQRLQANEAAAVQNLHVVCGAQVTFNSSNNHYGTFDELSKDTGNGAAFLPGDWAQDCLKLGYIFNMSNVGPVQFTITATPMSPGKSGWRTYVIDETGEISWSGA